MKKIFLIGIIFAVCSPCSLYSMDYAIYRLIKHVVKYPERLERRRHKPETRDQYYKVVDTQFEHFLIHKDPADLQFTLHEEWKKDWWDRNPGWSDLITYAGPIVILIFIGSIINRVNSDAHVGGNNQAAARNNFDGPAYHLDSANSPPPNAPPPAYN